MVKQKHLYILNILILITVIVITVIVCAIFISSRNILLSPAPKEDTSPIVQFKEKRIHLYVCRALDSKRLANDERNIFDVTEEQCASLKEVDIHYITLCETLDDLLYLKNLEKLRLPGLYSGLLDLDELREEKAEHSRELLSQLSEILPQLPYLTTLSIGRDVTVEDLSFLRTATGLKTLIIEPAPKDISDIVYLEELEWVGLGEGLLNDATPLSELHNLKIVGLRENQIDDITPLLELKNLKTIRITGNPVCEDAEQMQMLREAFPDAEIDFFDKQEKNAAG